MDNKAFGKWPSSTEAAFNNIVVMRVLGEIVDKTELPKLRLINRVCNYIGSACSYRRHAPVKFTKDKEITDFIETMETRNKNIPFPYSKFDTYLGNLHFEPIVEFTKNFGKEVIEYQFNRWVYNSRATSPGIFENIPNPHDLLQMMIFDFNPKLSAFLTGTEMNLEKIVFQFRTNVSILPDEVDNFPPVFPRLRIIESLDSHPILGGPVEISTLLAQRAPNLQYMDITLACFLRTLPQKLFLTSHQQTPRLSIRCSMLTKNSIHAIRYLCNGEYRNIGHFNFSINSNEFEDSEDLVVLIQQMTTLLRFQTNSMKSLNMTIQQHHPNWPILQHHFHIPPLLRLNSLNFNFGAYHFVDSDIIIDPITNGKFPNLQSLTIHDSGYTNEKYFEPNLVMPSVQNLYIFDYSPAQKTLHQILPNLTRLEFEIVPSFETMEYIFTHLTNLKSLNLGDLIRFAVLLNPLEYWNRYTGQANQLSKIEFSNLCSGKLNPQVQQTLRGENGMYLVSSLANMDELMELRVTLSSPLELEALVFMSRPGKMKPLKKLTLVYSKLPEGRAQQYERIRTHFILDTTCRRKYMRILKAYHEKVEYLYLIAGREIPYGIFQELGIGN